jgi:uncharacterized SAM-binding protein YcdF (DUF218 family)
MFFTLSKILSILLNPLIWVFLFFLWAIITSKPQKKQRLLLLSVFILYFFSNPFIFDECMRKWEVETISRDSLTHYKYGIVPGGMASFDQKYQRINFDRSTDRLLQALDLYHKGYIDKIVISSGSGSLINQDIKEADFLKDYLLLTGFPENDLIIENQSRNTFENAKNTYKKLKDDSYSSCILLITSASHMQRAKACFERQGFEVTPYPTDRYAGPRKWHVGHLLIPYSSTLYKWNFLIHEITGIIAYKLIGYI